MLPCVGCQQVPASCCLPCLCLDTMCRPQHLLVFVNPFGGKRQARRTWAKLAEPILSAAGVDCQVVETQHQVSIRMYGVVATGSTPRCTCAGWHTCTAFKVAARCISCIYCIFTSLSCYSRPSHAACLLPACFRQRKWKWLAACVEYK